MLEKLCKRILAIENRNKINFIELCLNHDAAHFESLKWSDFIWGGVYHDFCFHITRNIHYLTSLQLLLPIKINPFICWLSHYTHCYASPLCCVYSSSTCYSLLSLSLPSSPPLVAACKLTSSAYLLLKYCHSLNVIV